MPQGGELLAERMLRYFEAARPGRRGGRVLDLCCGSGRAARYLGENGYDVLGLDLSPAMIAQATKQCRALVRAGRVRFRVEDVREFDDGDGFDLAVSPWDGLNHLEDLDQLRSCFRCVLKSLVPGGMFIFDIVGREALIHDTVTVERHHDWVAMLEERYSPESGRSQTRFSGFVQQKGGLYARYDQTLSWTLFRMADVARALRSTGFHEIRLLDEETLEQELVAPEEAPRVFFVATRSSRR